MTTLTLHPPPDFRFAPTVNSHGWRDLAPFRYDEAAGTLHYPLALGGGRIAALDIGRDGDAVRVTTPAALNDAEAEAVRAAVSRMLSFDHDLAPFYALCRAAPRYAWIERAGAGRMLVSPTVWEDLVKTLLTTNTTWRMTRSMVERVVTLSGDGTFPTPAQISAFTPAALDAQVRAGYRSAYLHTLATGIAAGAFDAEALRDPAFRAQLVEAITSGVRNYFARHPPLARQRPL